MSEERKDEEQPKVPDVLPVLPLRDIVIFPFMIVPLYVSRDRSIKAVDHALAENRMILLAAQKKQGDETWQKFLSGRAFAQQETDNFLLFGSVEAKDLENIGTAVEKALPSIKKTAGVGAKDELWPGKLVLHVFKERGEFGIFIRNIEKRPLDKDETGSHVHKTEMSYIYAGPPGSGLKGLPLDLEATYAVARRRTGL